ncbi:MAG TPA: hypothetical protein VMA98_01670 [Candidatus Acidoferrales bacterium]|nr:hypothetical protein [Candidatus Acidoferrales bacterium]
MASLPHIAAIIFFTPKPAWLDLNRDNRRKWLRDRIAALREFGFGDASRLIWSKKLGDDVVTLWYIYDASARDRLVEQMELPAVTSMFDIAVAVGRIAADDDEVIDAFLDA